MTAPGAPFQVAAIGFGAIGQALAASLHGDARIALVQVVVPRASLAGAAAVTAGLAPRARVLDALDLHGAARPDLVVECAGHAALDAHIVPALRAGVPAVVASVGALSDTALLERLDAAAAAGGTRLRLVAGAVGAIDALAAARHGGKNEVTYVGEKRSTNPIPRGSAVTMKPGLPSAPGLVSSAGKWTNTINKKSQSR